MSAKQLERFAQCVPLRQISLACKNIRCVKNNAQSRRANFIQQFFRFPCVAHHVARLRFHRQLHVKRLYDPKGKADTLYHFIPSCRRGIIRVIAPHVVGIACPGAQRNHRRGQGLASSSQNSKPPQVLIPRFEIRVNQIEGSRNRRDPDRMPVHCRPDLVNHRKLNLIGQGRQPRITKVELNERQTSRSHFLKCRFNRRTPKRLAENAEWNHTSPCISLSFFQPPNSTERATAASARIFSTPSATLAPTCGVPSRIDDANDSSCNL